MLASTTTWGASKPPGPIYWFQSQIDQGLVAAWVGLFFQICMKILSRMKVPKLISIFVLGYFSLLVISNKVFVYKLSYLYFKKLKTFLQCVAGHCYYPLSRFLSFFSVFCFWNTSGKLPCVKICFPQYFGITRRYMQKNIIFR